MARAETIETVGENGGGRNGPLSCHNTCRMELPQPLHTRPGLLTTRTSVSPFHLQNNLPHMEPLQAIYMSNQLPYSQDEAQTYLQSPVLSPSPTPSCCPVRDKSSWRTVSPSDSSEEEEPDSNREEHQDASSHQGPLPDLLPQNEHSSWASPPLRRDLGGEATQQLDVRRVANQLRMIGDEFNARVLHRAHVAPQWQDWRDVCRGFLNFIAQTLSTLYRLT